MSHWRQARPSSRPDCRRSPLGHQRDHHPAGWTTWHRVIGNDSTQGAADAKYMKDTAKRQEDLRHRRRPGLQHGPGRIRQGGARLGHDRRGRRAAEADRLRPRRSPRSCQRRADAVFYARLLRRGRPAVQAAASGRLQGRCSCPATARRTRRSSRRPAPRPPRAPSCPLRRHPAPADFDQKYKALNGKRLRPVLDPGVRRGEHLPGRYRRGQDEPRGHEHVHRHLHQRPVSAVRSSSTTRATSRRRRSMRTRSRAASSTRRTRR